MREKESEREREVGRERERERERENGEIERKTKKLKREEACLETAIKFSIDSIFPKFLHLSMHLSLTVT